MVYINRIYFCFAAIRQDLIHPPTIKVHRHTDVKIKCLSVEGQYWKFNGVNLPPNAYDLGDGVLLLKSIKMFNYGIYECYGLVPNTTIAFYASAEVKIYCKLILTLRCVKELCGIYYNIRLKTAKFMTVYLLQYTRYLACVC